jgi:DsbC/DsbD-like thiol-disulfide interchange protein
VAVSDDPVSILADFSERRGITFPLLSDAGSTVIKQYGLLNTTVPPDNSTFGIPYPGTFILDANGVVRSRFFESAYQERNTMTSILLKLGAKLDVPAAKIASPHLTVTTYLTDRIAAPGTHFSAAIEIAPAAHVHVYAPGVSGYKPVAIAIQPQPGLVVRATQFPKSEDYFFKPLGEHVAVYQKPFRVVQDLEIDPSPQAASALNGRTEMTIAGTLDYQACDDEICFTPQSVPLTWTIGLRALDRERSKK